MRVRGVRIIPCDPPPPPLYAQAAFFFFQRGNAPTHAMLAY